MTIGRATLAAIAIGAGALGAAGYFLWSNATAPAVPTATDTEASINPTPAPPVPTLAATVPSFKLADRDGQTRSLADWTGKSLVVNFWATWCAPCRREIPLLQTIARERGPDGFQVIGIAVDFREKVLEYAEAMNITYPLLIGEQDGLDAAAAFGVEAVGFPFTVFSDDQGRVIAAHMGELHADQARLILDTVERVNSGQLDPLAARAAIETGLAAMQHARDRKSAG